MPPQRPDLVLSSHVPHVELDIFVCYCLDVEADSRYGGNVLVKLELVKNGYKNPPSAHRFRASCERILAPVALWL